ncbi:alpha/beta fold hydrolase [Rhizobium leguminosarum]|uniref:alpha/beta fold hydrolase n=1 Tax=Rhizobium leguminosarum TaxID=384 RepID=UPI003F948A64
MTGLIDGFEQRRLRGDGIEIDALIGGNGPPLLLLHGWPQTRRCWAAVAPALTDIFTVVVPDLRGYGRSDKPDGGPDVYSKRAMARDQIAVMNELGFKRFAVGAHDRGARVAYRLALDHTEIVTRLASLDVIPTADMWANMRAKEAVSSWHWSMMAQPDGLPEKLIGADPEWLVRYILEHQSGHEFQFPEENVTDYVTCAKDPMTVRGWCGDYRAGWGVDRELDEADRGRKLAMPMLMLWGEQGTMKGKDGLEPWRTWADHVEGEALPCGHFIPEEQPERVVAWFRRFFAAKAP